MNRFEVGRHGKTAYGSVKCEKAPVFGIELGENFAYKVTIKSTLEQLNARRIFFVYVSELES